MDVFKTDTVFRNPKYTYNDFHAIMRLAMRGFLSLCVTLELNHGFIVCEDEKRRILSGSV